MIVSRLNPLIRRIALSPSTPLETMARTATTTKTGAVRPEPHRTTFGLLRVIAVVIPGLFLGAGISKSFANFLEENDLFVPSDDDDDDD